MTKEKYWKFLAHLFTRYESDLLNNIEQLSKKPCQGITLLNACYESELETLREAIDEHKAFMNQVEAADDTCGMRCTALALHEYRLKRKAKNAH